MWLSFRGSTVATLRAIPILLAIFVCFVSGTLSLVGC
jgi:hypothetical protein